MTIERNGSMRRAAPADLILERDGLGAGERLWPPLSNRWFLLACRLLLAAVFTYAALQKIGRPLLFADEIRMYGVIDHGPALYLLAIVLPWVELFCGISLLTGLLMRGSALILAVVNVVFIVVIAYRSAAIMNAEGIGLSQVFFDCGCGFGPTYAWKKLIEDTVFFFAALAILSAPGYRLVLATARGRRKG
ncbi:MAG: DoxX family membrane protein [Candidatus Krumholzibacteria bacterium]|nr:DoxX family membrane protein [Candidatus Krumholzibacteria bacterium]